MADVLEILCQVHAKVRGCLEDAEWLTDCPTCRNAKGDVQHPFDVAADAVIRSAIVEGFGSGIVLSEESGEAPFGPGKPAYRFIVDPVDGSDNCARGLPLAAVSIAVLPVDSPMRPDRVRWAMVGGIGEAIPATAGWRAGAYRGCHPLHVSGVRDLSSAFLSCELNHFAPLPPVARLMRHARAVRSYGCASQAITLVATGALDVHVDLRVRLTPESFLAAALILQEAGGCVWNLDGQPLREVESLLSRTSLVAAATPELAQEVLDVLAA